MPARPKALEAIVLRPSGGTNGNSDTAAINNALAAHRTVILMGGIGAGRFHLNDSIQQPSNTTLVLWDAEVFLVGGTSKRLWRNANQTATGDSRIHVVGVGRALFNGNAANQVRQPGFGFLENIGFGPVKVDNLHVRDIQIGPTNGWGAFLQGVTNATFRNITLEQDRSVTYQDGIDIGVGCSNVRIKGVRGTTGDDVFAIMGMQYASAAFGSDGNVGVPLHPIYQPGSALSLNVSDISFADVDVAGPFSLLRTLSDNTCVINRVTMKGARNSKIDSSGALFSTGSPSAFVDPARQPAPGCLQNVTLEGLVGGSFPSAPLIELNNHIDGLNVRGIDVHASGFPHSIIGKSSTDATTQRRIVVDGVKAQVTGSGFVGDLMRFGAGTVQDVSIRNVDLREAQAVLNNSVAVTNLDLRDVRVGLCYRIPFNSSVAEQGQARGVQVGALASGVAKRYGTAMALRLGPAMPHFSSVDTTPLATTTQSEIICDSSKDPTGGAATTAGKYIANGTSWLKIIDMGAMSLDFSPLSLNPVAWYRPETLAGLAEGAAVSSWSDSSGNAHGLSAPAGSPVWRSGGTLRGVEFSTASDRRLDATSVVVAQPSTIFVVAQAGSLGASRQIVDGITTRQAIFARTGGTWAYFAGTEQSGSGTSDLNPHVFAAVFNGASSSLRKDGAVISSANPGSTGLSGLRLGAFDATSGRWDGRIAEVIVYTGAMTTANISQVEQFLGAKNGITIA